MINRFIVTSILGMALIVISFCSSIKIEAPIVGKYVAKSDFIAENYIHELVLNKGNTFSFESKNGRNIQQYYSFGKYEIYKDSFLIFKSSPFLLYSISKVDADKINDVETNKIKIEINVSFPIYSASGSKLFNCSCSL